MIKIIRSFMILVYLVSMKVHAAVDNLTTQALIEAQQQGAVVIDIRTPEEWADTGTIAGAQRIMFFDRNRRAQVKSFMNSLESVVTDKNQPIILVCRSGNRTATAARFLAEEKGYTNVSHLARGMKQWAAEKLEVEKD